MRKCWVIPPEQNADFVASMEDVLEVYKKPYDANFPVVCMDEQPIQLIKETKIPLAAESGKLVRYDYQYERNGTAVGFMFTEPLGHWRNINISERKTSIDWSVTFFEFSSKA